MSLLGSITNKPKLLLANKNLTKARKSDGSKADYLYESANKVFKEIAEGNSLKSEALYKWGFSLFNQGKTKKDDEAALLLNEACEKFSASIDADPLNIKPAIDWGVTLMAIADLKNVDKNDQLYDLATEKFQIAEGIFYGSAAYNLACIFAIRGDQDACKQSLEDARDNASLPTKNEILNDTDLNNVKDTEWFKDFVPTITNPPPLRKTRRQLAEEEEAKADADAEEETLTPNSNAKIDENDTNGEDSIK